MKSPPSPILGTLLSLALFPAPFPQAQQLENPVAQCADCVMAKHRGTYYMTGTSAAGKMLASQNLTDWAEPVPFFQTRLRWTHKEHTLDMHAPSLKYHNGRFYFYWNGIACATAEKPLGPYADLDPNKRFDGEIDPFLFIDEDGKFYFYSVKFDRGNIIYGQEMESPLKLKGSAVRLLEARSESWEMRDGNILEGPEVVRHRNTCYMLYAANHTRTSRGQYLVGCAAADSPLGFNEASKYPYPVMEQSDERIADSAKTIFAWGAEWRYATHPPEDNWMLPDFQGSEPWPRGRGGFGSPIVEHARYHNVRTEWTTGDIWMRLEFELAQPPSPNLQLKLRHQGDTQIYLNGKPVYSNPDPAGPCLVTLAQEDIATLHAGKNTIAVHCRAPQEERFIDVGLIDPGNRPEDDLVWNTGQPNLVRGPNGFEWFVSYFAIWNRSRHSQGINRTFFFGNELYIDGPTGSRPPQYQPLPYPASFSGNMDHHGELPPEKWNILGGEWRVADGQAEAASRHGTAIALVRAEPATDYLFQAWAKPLRGGKGSCGIVAWHVDGKNSVLLLLDGRQEKLVCTQYLNGKRKNKTYPLPKDFDFSAYHKIRFEKNSGLAEVWVDDTRLTRAAPLVLPAGIPGTPGLFASQTPAAFDAVAYTIGWDEYGERIQGWNMLDGSAQNSIQGKPAGLVLDARKNRVACSKGDRLECYEFSAQLSFLDSRGVRRKAGIYPVYIDPENYLCVEIEPANHRLAVSGKRDGKKIQPMEKDLAGWRRLYLKTSTNLHLKRPGTVSAIKLEFENHAAGNAEILYRNKTGRWLPVENPVREGNVFRFVPVETDRIRIKPTDNPVARAQAWVAGEPSLNIRTVKLRSKVLVMVDGKQVLEIPGEWPKSKTGLCAENGAVAFNGIVRFQIPEALQPASVK